MLITGLMDIYALLFGISGGIFAEIAYGQPLGGFFATLFNNASVTDLWGSILKCTMFGAIIAIVCSYKGMNASGGAEGVGRAVNEAVVIAFLGVFAFNYVFTQTLLATHPEISVDQVSDVLMGWLRGTPRLARLARRDRPLLRADVMGLVYSGRVFQFFGEALRQAGILILGSAIVIWGLVFILGLQCGIEGAYFNRSVGAPAYAGVFAAWCDLREVIPYAFGYMMAAKVGTGIVAELGAMRISDEIDALEVMGVNPMIFLCATRLLGAWLTLPFMYLAGDRRRLLRLLPGGGRADRRGLVGRLLPDLLDVPEPTRPHIQPDQGDDDGDGDRAGRLLLRLHRRRAARSGWAPRPRSRWSSTSCLVHIIGMMGTLVFWGANPRAPIGG